MTQIKKILDKQGNEVFIRTSTKAVVDENGYTAESRLQAMQDEINQAQLEVGAVPSDLTPTENSTNWVTSGGVYNATTVGSTESIDLSGYTAVRAAISNLNTWIVNNDTYVWYGIFVRTTGGVKYKITGNDNYNTTIAFLTSNIPGANGSNVTTFAGNTKRININSGSTVVLQAPDDAKYVLLFNGNGEVGNRLPKSFEKDNRLSVVEILGNTDETPIKGSDNLVTSGGVYSFQPINYETLVIDTDSMDSINYGLDTNKWFAGNKSVVIPCTPGDTFALTVNKISGDGAWWSWLTSDYVAPTPETVDVPPPYVSGYTRTWLQISSGETSANLSVTTPAGASYLILGLKASYNTVKWTGTVNVSVKLIDIINQKASVAYVDNTKTEIEADITKSKYTLISYEDVWSSNDTSAITVSRSGDDLLINVISKTSFKRAGFSIANIGVGERLYIDFTSSTGVVFGVGSTLSGDFINVGTFTKSFYFKKTSSTQNYLYIPANSYSSGMVLTLNDFKVYKAVGTGELDLRLNRLEDYAWNPSSYIPIKEGYENYMSISASNSGQGSAIYGNFFVQGFTYVDRIIKIYNLETKSLVQEVSLPTFANTRYHTNTMSFSGTKYDNSDDFPLLYICSGYTDSSSVSTSEVYVVRIIGTSGNYTTSLIQTIYLDFGSWTEFVCDPIKNRAWINGSRIATYICIDLPSISNSEVTIDSSTTIIDKFNRKSFALGTSTTSSGQGRFFYHNRIYWVSGVPSYTGEGEDALYIVVDNTLTHCTEAVVPLKNFGLSSGTSNTYEPEGCFIWNDDFYVTYRSFIAKIIQN